eukprot:15452341-Alexandrium_andersonii.AAC.1
MALSHPQGAAQSGGGVSGYLAHSDQNGPLASPGGLLSRAAECRYTPHGAIKKALSPPQGGCPVGRRSVGILRT